MKNDELDDLELRALRRAAAINRANPDVGSDEWLALVGSDPEWLDIARQARAAPGRE
jgi:hypothetical protein